MTNSTAVLPRPASATPFIVPSVRIIAVCPVVDEHGPCGNDLAHPDGAPAVCMWCSRTVCEEHVVSCGADHPEHVAYATSPAGYRVHAEYRVCLDCADRFGCDIAPGTSDRADERHYEMVAGR